MKPESFYKRIIRRFKAQDPDPEDENDLSYEDALLDWKLRRFMQAEYGNQQPPQGVFNKVLAAIKSGGSTVGAKSANLGSLLKSMAAGLYNALAKPTAATRLVPGIVAFGLVVMVLSTNSNNIVLHNNITPNFNNLPAVSRPDVIIKLEQEQQEKSEQVTRRGNVPEGLYQFYLPANIDFSHPVERHLSPVKKHTTDTEQDLSSSYLIISKGSGF